MRLPFNLGRRSGPANGAAGASSHAPGPAAPETPRPPIQRAWADLPPIQRATGSMPLVAAPGEFAGALPGTTPLPPIVEPLGHEVSPMATPGLVVAHARPVEAGARSPLPAPVQRQAARRTGAHDDPAAASDAAVDEPAPAAAATDAGGGAGRSPAPAVRSLQVVAREAVRVPDRPLTSASAPAAIPRSGAVQRSASPGSPSPAAPAAAIGSPHTGLRRASTTSIGTPLSVARQASSPAPSPAPQDPPDHAAPVMPTVARSSSAGSRRAGLGEPLGEVPRGARPATEARLSGSPGDGAVPYLPAPAAASIQRSTASASGSAGSAAVAAQRTPAPSRNDRAPASTSRPLPVLPVASAAPRTAPVQRVASSDAPAAPRATVRPTVGRDPIRPAVSIQREGPDDSDAGPGPADAPGLEAPSAWWQPTAGEDAAPRPLPTLQASRPGTGTNAPSSTSRSAARAFDEAPGRQPAAWSTPPAPLQRTAHSVAPTLPAPRPIATAVPAAAAPVTPAAPTLSSAIVAAASTSATPALQRSPAAVTPAAAPPTPTATAFVQRVEGEAPAPRGEDETAKGRPSERELDELARAIFGRIRGRLRNELIHDREARGLTFDNV